MARLDLSKYTKIVARRTADGSSWQVHGVVAQESAQSDGADLDLLVILASGLSSEAVAEAEIRRLTDVYLGGPRPTSGIWNSQEWTGQGGMGPRIRLIGFDLKAMTVRFEYMGTWRTPERPGGTMEIARLLESYRLAE